MFFFDNFHIIDIPSDTSIFLEAHMDITISGVNPDTFLQKIVVSIGFQEIVD